MFYDVFRIFYFLSTSLNTILSLLAKIKLPLNKKFHSNFLIYIIKKEGLNWFVDKCKEKGYNKFRDKYIASCQLCAELFKDNYVMDLLYDDMKEYCKNELSKV